MKSFFLTLLCLFLAATPWQIAHAGNLQALDLFDLEYASDPQISPAGDQIVYVRRGFDIMGDVGRASLWRVSIDSAQHEPLTSSGVSPQQPRWSPDGSRLAYVARIDGRNQLHVRWMQTGNVINITHLSENPGNLVWSPDGQFLAFTQRVAAEPAELGIQPKAPKSATWSEPAVIVDDLLYRWDGGSFNEPGFDQIFIVAASGGAPRQLTQTPYHHDGTMGWSPDGRFIYYSNDYNEDWQRRQANSDIYELEVATGKTRQLTSRFGRDEAPQASPDGKQLLFLSAPYADGRYQVQQLHVMNLDGQQSLSRSLTPELDRDIDKAVWAYNGKSIYVSYIDKAVNKIARVDLQGRLTAEVEGLGGNSIGRPYSSGSFTVARNGALAYTRGDALSPADVGYAKGKRRTQLTTLNRLLLEGRDMATLEEIWYPSSADGLMIQGWILKPAGFDPAKRYPLILEIHGGPQTSYSAEFAMELQLYAAAGYVVLYTNPRGSTSYGEAFTNKIYKAYPGQDYDDLMSGVDVLLERGYIDADNLFVTGGSGGGVLTAWIVGKTDRFRAAVSAKPVINWYSHTLTADIGSFFWEFNFDSPPWESPMEYQRRSPISLVGNVSTPTMLLTGEEDYRTPMAESEQYYQALKMRGVDTLLVRMPGASHSLTSRPANLLRKVAYILGWFERYKAVPE